LQAFPLATNGARAILYLCPNCFRKRKLDKADASVLGAALFLIAGVLIVGFSLPSGSSYWLMGGFMILVGAVWVWYAIGQRSEVPPEIVPETMPEAGLSVEEKGAMSEDAEAEEAERLYDQLFTKYVEHWGIQTGAQLLESEIQAYTRHGDSYAQAMRKIADRIKRKPL
jgi:hypothetical protein